MSKIFFNLDDMMWNSRIKSINQLHEMTGISRPTLTAIKNNKSVMVHLETLSILCKHLDCNINDLLKYEK